MCVDTLVVPVRFIAVEGYVIFITNVHEEAAEEDIYDVFAEYGDIKNVHLNLDRRTGLVKGYCLIEYDTYKEAKESIERMNGASFRGKKLGVSWAFSKGPVVGKQKKRGRKTTYIYTQKNKISI